MSLEKEVQNNKLQILGKLAASLAHEIRNPLSALKLNLDYLNLSKEQLSSENAECLDACMDSVERIHLLIENTLDFSRKTSRQEAIYTLNDVIKQALAITESEARRHGIRILTEISGRTDYLVDKNKILQVILNLLTNAIEASEKNSEVFLRLFENEEGLVLQVEDKGVGIKDEHKEKIFSDFFTSKKHGTGLGLSVCRMLLHEIGAVISFTSSEGKGTVFTVIFPSKISEE